MKVDTNMSLISVLNQAKDYQTVVMGLTGAAIDYQRNMICHFALKQSATHVLFVDTDMEFRSNTLNQLLALEKPVVGVASRKKKIPLQYTIEIDEPTGARNITDDELPPDPFCKINGHRILVGAGIMLIDLAKVKDTPKPWFHMDSFWNEGEEPGYTREDLYLCR